MSRGCCNGDEPCGKDCDKNLCQPAGIAASMPVTFNFASGPKSQPIGGSFEIRPLDNASNASDLQNNLDMQVPSHGGPFRTRHSEVPQLPDFAASNPPSTDPLTNTNYMFPELTPYPQWSGNTPFPTAGSMDPSGTDPIDGPSNRPIPDQAANDLDVPGVGILDSSWNSYGIGGGFLGPDDGPDINLSYYFNGEG